MKSWVAISFLVPAIILIHTLLSVGPAGAGNLDPSLGKKWIDIHWYIGITIAIFAAGFAVRAHEITNENKNIQESINFWIGR